ncbi:hypothetical protein EJ02DRAFT_445202 [Clathrospora elynae]|uniref:Methyltransferase type 11 domain-containing protein n=1 Tax=Clathrospora elynae TaxID=706981 RepID=A0A6A5SMK5_9PLEO|nr:hypothetical protein EJ02DRAFT_445202 [Clathrospora elynae]
MAAEYSKGKDFISSMNVWAIDVAEDPKLNAEVDGFDVSDKFFPPQAWLPCSLSLRLQDVTAPFSAERLGTYDLVHFRLFLTLTTEKLDQLLENAIKLLKPGGYIQWVEHDKTSMKPVAASAEGSTEAVEAFIGLQQSPFPNYRAAWVNEIAPMLANKGMKVVAEDRFQTRPNVAPGLSSSVDTFKEKYFDELAKDSQNGVALIDGFIVVVAQKPL